MNLLQEKFAELDGQTITIFTMINDQGMEVSTIDYGTRLPRSSFLIETGYLKMWFWDLIQSMNISGILHISALWSAGMRAE